MLNTNLWLLMRVFGDFWLVRFNPISLVCMCLCGWMVVGCSWVHSLFYIPVKQHLFRVASKTRLPLCYLANEQLKHIWRHNVLVLNRACDFQTWPM